MTLDEDTLDALTVVQRGHWHHDDWQGTASIAIRVGPGDHHGRKLSDREFESVVIDSVTLGAEPVQYAPEKVRDTLVGVAVRAHGHWWSAGALAFIAPVMVRVCDSLRALVVLDAEGDPRALIMATTMTDAEVEADRYAVNLPPSEVA